MKDSEAWKSDLKLGEMAGQRGHPIHRVLEREQIPAIGYSSDFSVDELNGGRVEASSLGNYLTAHLSETGESYSDYHETSMTEEVRELGPTEEEIQLRRIVGLTDGDSENDLIVEIMNWMVRSTRGSRGYEYRVWGNRLSRARRNEFRDVEFVPLGIYGEDGNGVRHQLNFVKKHRGYFDEEFPLRMDHRWALLWLNYTILKWSLVWLEE